MAYAFCTQYHYKKKAEHLNNNKKIHQFIKHSYRNSSYSQSHCINYRHNHKQ